MLYHMVMLEPENTAAMARIHEAMAILETLPARLPGFTAFSHGPNRDFEAKSARYPYGFLCTFADKPALDVYTADPDHQRAGALLVGACKNGAAGIFVVDLET